MKGIKDVFYVKWNGSSVGIIMVICGFVVRPDVTKLVGTLVTQFDLALYLDPHERRCNRT